MHPLSHYQKLLTEHLNQSIQNLSEPTNLYEPMQYLLQIGGKRLRPVLTLLATDLYQGNAQQAIPAALAVEWFHNFTLMHDDIMDKAPLRRGKQTVHERWNTNTAILSGDAMLINAYQFLEAYEPVLYTKLMQLFNKTALEVCEGQQWDMNFENQETVSIAQYLKMIEYKTAVLVGCALKMGAYIAYKPEEEATLIYNFGLNLGLAFQLQDDYLDVFGNPETFGKQVGGDIAENKKTYLYLKALEHYQNPQELADLYTLNPTDPTEKIAQVTEIFNTSGAAEQTLKAVESYTEKAIQTLEKLNLPTEHKQYLKTFAYELMGRGV